MKLTAFSLTLCLIIISCSKTDLQRGVESFSSSSFKTFESRIYGNDLLVSADESLIVAGAAIEDGGISFRPCVLAIDPHEEISWMRFLPDNAAYVTNSMSIRLTASNHYLLLLNSRDKNTNDDYRIDLRKVDQFGNIIWTQKIPLDSINLSSTSVVELNTGDYIIFSEDEQNISPPNKLHLTRISSDGEVIWAKTIEESQASTSSEMIYFPEEGSIIGMSQSNNGLFNGAVDIYKFDLDGNLLWEKSLAESATLWPSASHLKKLATDRFMAMFTANNNVVLMNIDRDGEIAWEKTYGGRESDVAQDLVQTADGQYVLLSNTSSFGNGDLDAMLTKIDEEGNTIWKKVYGSAFSDQSIKIAELSNGDLVVIGNSNEGNSSNSHYDLFLLRTDSEGVPK